MASIVSVRIDRPSFASLQNDPFARAIYVKYSNGDEVELGSDSEGVSVFVAELLRQKPPFILLADDEFLGVSNEEAPVPEGEVFFDDEEEPEEGEEE